MPTPVASWTIIRLLFVLTTPSASPIILKRLTLFTGGLEFGFLLFIAFLLFGPKKLPEIARTLGKGMAELRRASNELKSSLEEEIKNLDRVPEPSDRPGLVDADQGRPVRQGTEMNVRT